MTKSIAVIGAGHNGLIAATLLAQQGFKVAVYEASASIGGGAQTHEFAPGFKTSSIAHLLFHWDSKLESQLALQQNGLRLSAPLPSVALSTEGSAIVYDHHQLLAGDYSEVEAVHYREAMLRFNSLAQWLARENKKIPARLGWDRWRDALPALGMMIRMRLLGRDLMRDLLRLGTMAIHDVLNEELTDNRLKGALALDAVLGSHCGSRSGNSFFSWLHRLSGLSQGGYLQVLGGMGALTGALISAAQSHGVSIHTNARVLKINTRGERVSGLTLESGQEIYSDAILSAMSAPHALLNLLGAHALSVEQSHQLRHLRQRGNVAKVHIAIKGQVQFHGVSSAHQSARMLIAPSSEAVDNAFNPVKYQQCANDLVMELHVPSVLDDTLAPAGHQVVSAIVPFIPFDCADPNQLRHEVTEKTMAVIEKYMPQIRGHVVASECLLPIEMESRFNIPKGHWHHTELAIDQALMLRPIPRLAQYRGPVNGLWLCGASMHPGGGIHGRSAQLAVDTILQDLRA